MDTKQVIFELRTQMGMSQDELAEKVFVSRQAVSRWENGETVPNTETLKLLSKVFDVSINTLLGSPRKLVCQCCGMPLEDDNIIGHNHDGSFNEDYCKWCYADGTYTYNDMDDLIEVCVKNMVSENFTKEQARTYMKELLPTLDYWKKYDELSDNGQFEKFKKKLINEINELDVDGMPKVEKLNALVGKYVNLEYQLPNGQVVKFLNEAKTYLGNQLGYWENRGFAKLPFCVIYGFGTLIAFNIFKPIEHNYIALYIFGCICATAFEYLTAQVMLKLFGEVWWNYDHLKFNYKGIICLQSTLAWGFVAVFIFGFLNKFVERFVFSIDYRIASVMAMILVFSYTADFMQSFSESLNMQNMDIRAEMRKFIKMFHK